MIFKDRTFVSNELVPSVLGGVLKGSPFLGARRLNQPIMEQIDIYRHSDGMFVRRIRSKSDGSFNTNFVPFGQEYFLLMHDPLKVLNTAVSAYQSPEQIDTT